MSVEKKRIVYVDVMKAIGIIFVLVYHIFNDPFIEGWLNVFQLPIFLFAAGIVFQALSLKAFLIKKFNSLLLPYFAWGGVTLCYYFLIEASMRTLDLSFWECFVRGIILGEYSFLRFNSPLWFLPCFFMVNVLYLGLYKLIKMFFDRRASLFCLIIVSLLYLFSVLFPLNVEVWSLNRTPRFLFYYACGVVFHPLSEIIASLLTKNGKRRKVFLIISIVGLGLSVILYKIGVIDLLITGFGIFGTLCLSVVFSNCKLLNYIGMRTLTIMVIHGPIYRVIIYVIGRMLNKSTESVREDFFLVVITLCITLLLCLSVDVILKKGKQYFRYEVWEKRCSNG